MKPIDKFEEQILKLAEQAPKMTDESRAEQRRSFVFGNTAAENEHITRELVDNVDAGVVASLVGGVGSIFKACS